MKPFTKAEIRFIKETKFTPTVYQCDEYERTSLKDYSEAFKVAKEKYNFNLDNFLNKTLNDDCDCISLEFLATYLLYCFFTKDELEKLTPAEGLEWLRNYKYYFGFRKWDEQFTEIEINEALQIYNGKRVFYLQNDGNVWNTELENFKENPYFEDKKLLNMEE